MATNKGRWANILCNEKMIPFKLIVTEGEWTTEIPISNTRLPSVKRWTYELYNVSYKRMLTTQIFDGGEVNEKS